MPPSLPPLGTYSVGRHELLPARASGPEGTARCAEWFAEQEPPQPRHVGNSFSANALTLRAWREANPEKYAAQKARQYARRKAKQAA